MSKDNGGSAFASNAVCTDGHVLQEGMSLRDYFAGQALQGIFKFADNMDDGGPYRSHEEIATGLASLSYKIADAMLTARKS